MLETGIVISQLVKRPYDALKAALVSQFHQTPHVQKSKFPLDTCFNFQVLRRPLKLRPSSITYHFQDGFDRPICKEVILAS